MPIKVVKLLHVGVRVDPSDAGIEAASDFYAGLLGLETDVERPEIPGIPGCRIWGDDAPPDEVERAAAGRERLESDPDFNPGEPAFYYLRVVENPSCRWSQRLCAAAAVDCAQPDSIKPGYEACCAAGHRPVIQERAWTSPIWYQP